MYTHIHMLCFLLVICLVHKDSLQLCAAVSYYTCQTPKTEEESLSLSMTVYYGPFMYLHVCQQKNIYIDTICVCVCVCMCGCVSTHIHYMYMICTIAVALALKISGS